MAALGAGGINEIKSQGLNRNRRSRKCTPIGCFIGEFDPKGGNKK